MAEFNAMDTAAFKGVWVFCEQREGEIQSISYQLLSEGRKLANDLGVELCGVVMGSELNEDYVKALGGYGADRVYNIDSPLLKDYTTDGYAKALCDLIMDKKPEIMLIGATNLGRDLGPRCAARLHTGLCADCTHLDVDMPIYKDFLRGASTLPEAKIDGMATAKVMGKDHDVSRDLKMTRPAFGGNLMATIICPRFRPSMATVRPGVMKKNAFDEAKANGTWGIEYTTCQKCGYHNWTRKGNVYVCDTCGNETTTVVSAKGVKGYVGSGAIAPVANKAAAPETRYANAKQAQAAADAREAAYAAAVAAFQKQIAANEAAYLAAIAK